MERRWLVTDVATWYPVAEEPQRHFGSALEAYAKKDYHAAATEILKTTSYLRLEAGRATSEAQQALETSVAELDTLAASVEKETVKDEKTLVTAFTHSHYALSLAYRAKACTGKRGGVGWGQKRRRVPLRRWPTQERWVTSSLPAQPGRGRKCQGIRGAGQCHQRLGPELGSKKKAEPVHVGS